MVKFETHDQNVNALTIQPRAHSYSVQLRADILEILNFDIYEMNKTQVK